MNKEKQILHNTLPSSVNENKVPLGTAAAPSVAHGSCTRAGVEQSLPPFTPLPKAQMQPDEPSIKVWWLEISIHQCLAEIP